MNKLFGYNHYFLKNNKILEKFTKTENENCFHEILKLFEKILFLPSYFQDNFKKRKRQKNLKTFATAQQKKKIELKYSYYDNIGYFLMIFHKNAKSSTLLKTWSSEISYLLYSW